MSPICVVAELRLKVSMYPLGFEASRWVCVAELLPMSAVQAAPSAVSDSGSDHSEAEAQGDLEDLENVRSRKAG